MSLSISSNQHGMKLEPLEIRVRGQDVSVPSLVTDSYRLVSTGGLLKTAELFDEELVQSADFPDPGEALRALRAGGLRADIFSFARPFHREMDRLGMPHVIDNLAVLPTTSYDEWWNGLPQEGRKNVRLAAKRGVVARPVEFSDDLVQGIKTIYDETPVRQGRRFWHYQRDVERVRMMNATYLERSHFVGAYIDDQLVGFVKFIAVDDAAVLIQILAMDAHRDKRPIYALLQQTVELCHRQGLKWLTYGKYDYGVNQDSSLKEFKKRNGFVELQFPRYYVPLTLWGRACIAAGLHLGWRNMLPPGLKSFLHRARARLLQTVYKGAAQHNG